MKGFSGFPGDDKHIPLPASFFSEALPAIDDLAELKLTLFLLQLWATAEETPVFDLEELGARPELMATMAAADEGEMAGIVQRAAERAAARGTLIRVVKTRGDQSQDRYMINDEAGRQLAGSIAAGKVAEGPKPLEAAAWRVERPNIFILYEQNVGLLQPLIADELREAEQLYPAPWIEEAFQIAAQRNVRNWRYIRAILERWAQEGKGSDLGQDGSRPGPNRYTEGKYGHLVKR